MSDVFISYSHDDRVKVLRLVRALEAQGWTIWSDREAIAGAVWDQTIARELKRAQCVIVAWSKASVSSEFVKEEAGLALGQGKLLGVSLDQTAPPHQFSSIETFDLSRWFSSEDGANFIVLTRAIQSTVKQKTGDVARDTTPSKNRPALKNRALTTGALYKFASAVIAHRLAAGIFVAIAAAAVASVLLYKVSAWNEASSRVPPGHTQQVLDAEFSPDAARVITASADKTARLWDAANAKQVFILRGHRAAVNSASISPTGIRAVTASADMTARLWDVETCRSEGHEGAVNSASFSPDGRMVITASKDGTARIWHATTGKQIELLESNRESEVTSASFSPDGHRIITTSGDGTARVWDGTTGKQIRLVGGTRHGRVYAAAFSPDGTLVITAFGDGTTRIWDLGTGQQIASSWRDGEAIYCARFSPDGSRVITASADGMARIWSVSNGKEIAILRGHDNAIRSAAFSPDGKLVVTASADKTSRIWDASTGNQVAILPFHL